MIVYITGVVAFSGLETLYSLVVLSNYEEIVFKQQQFRRSVIRSIAYLRSSERSCDSKEL